MLQNKVTIAAVLMMFGASALVGGCGSSNKEGGTSSTAASANAQALESSSPSVALDASQPPTSTLLAGTINGIAVATEGTDSCANCHSTAGSPINVVAKTVGKTVGLTAYAIDKYSNSSHANQGSGVDGTNALCIKCHDPFADAAKIDALGTKLGTPMWATRVSGRAVVGCEACHGGGGMHRGVGPLPSGSPSMHRCGACHGKAWDSSAELTSHKTSYPEGYGIYEDYLASPHAKSVNSSVLVSGSTTDVTSTCSRCHTDEGSKTYITSASGTLTNAQMGAALDSKAAIANGSPVQCRTCHDAHNPGKLIGDKDLSLSATTWSSQFKTCTACHQLLKADGSTAEAYHVGTNTHIITDTHISVAGTPSYWIDPTNTRACSDCHNPHKADNTINNQFAASAHMDKTGAWDSEGDTTSANCQRCHTTTGFINYVGLVSANNNGATTVTNTSQTLPGKELLRCNACHTDNKGGLRNPKVWQYTNGNAATYVIPTGRMTASEVTFINSLGGSLLCAHCHMGRTTGQYVKNTTYTTQSAARSAANGDHYYGTWGWMFRTLGYEFTGGDYDTNGRPTHANIGTAGSVAAGNSNGPCVGCHMYPDPGKTKANHEFTVLTRDSVTNKVTAVLGYNATCVKCHTAGELERITDINTIESQYYSTIQAYRSVLAAKKSIFYKLASNPTSALAGTFKGNAAGTTDATWPLTAADTGNKTIGAGFNLRTMDYRLKGKAVFHNYLYTKRLMYDAIDFLDDGTLNNSVDATIAALTETTAYVNEDASEYQITAADKAAARLFLGATRP